MAAQSSTLSASGPAWDIARIFSDQGHILEGEYLHLTRYARRLVEYTDGIIEVLPISTTSHQRIVLFLYSLLMAWTSSRNAGLVLTAPLRVRLRDGKIREPDVVFMARDHLARAGEEFWNGADLVMEVVSPDGRHRDLIEKRAEYAEAKVPEYWIVDPQEARITVLTLGSSEYTVHGEFIGGTRASSALLKDFAVSVDEVFSAGRILA